MNLRIVTVAAAIAATSIGASGCKGGMPDSCIEAKASLGAVAAYVRDAQHELERARAIAAVLPPEQRAELMDRIDAADAALYAAEKLAINIGNQCQSFDPLSLFADFIRTWAAVKDLVMKSSKAELHVDPEVYKMSIPKESAE